MFVEFFAAFSQHVFVNVADGGDFDVLLFCVLFNVVLAPSIKAHNANAHHVIG